MLFPISSDIFIEWLLIFIDELVFVRDIRVLFVWKIVFVILFIRNYDWCLIEFFDGLLCNVPKLWFLLKNYLYSIEAFLHGRMLSCHYVINEACEERVETLGAASNQRVSKWISVPLLDAVGIRLILMHATEDAHADSNRNIDWVKVNVYEQVKANEVALLVETEAS